MTQASQAPRWRASLHTSDIPVMSSHVEWKEQHMINQWKELYFLSDQCPSLNDWLTPVKTEPHCSYACLTQSWYWTLLWSKSPRNLGTFAKLDSTNHHNWRKSVSQQVWLCIIFSFLDMQFFQTRNVFSIVSFHSYWRKGCILEAERE